jgi:hypothetical protein
MMFDKVNYVLHRGFSPAIKMFGKNIPALAINIKR